MERPNKLRCSPEQIEELALKVEQGSATKTTIWRLIGFRKTVDNQWTDKNGIILVNPPNLLTSIDAQEKYLPMQGWYIDQECYPGMSGDVWYTKFTRCMENGPDESVAGSSEDRKLSELSARLRALAWEMRNKEGEGL